jgi:hypothetical protein
VHPIGLTYGTSEAGPLKLWCPYGGAPAGPVWWSLCLACPCGVLHPLHQCPGWLRWAVAILMESWAFGPCSLRVASLGSFVQFWALDFGGGISDPEAARAHAGRRPWRGRSATRWSRAAAASARRRSQGTWATKWSQRGGSAHLCRGIRDRALVVLTAQAVAVWVAMAVSSAIRNARTQLISCKMPVDV